MSLFASLIIIVFAQLSAINYPSSLLLFTATLSTGDLRLAESDEYQYGGRLEYYYLGSWGTVCDDGWGYDDADVACDQMGFSYVSDSLLTYVTPGSPSQSIWVDDVRCSGYESRLSSCSGSFTGRHDCFHSEDVGIVCSRSCKFTTVNQLMVSLGPAILGLLENLRLLIYIQGQDFPLPSILHVDTEVMYWHMHIQTTSQQVI